MFITNMQNPRNGRAVPNQYCVITDDGKRYFQSYSSFIAMIDNDGEMYLHHNAYLSRTTKRYLKEFLGCHELSAKEFNKFISNLKTY